MSSRYLKAIFLQISLNSILYFAGFCGAYREKHKERRRRSLARAFCGRTEGVICTLIEILRAYPIRDT